MLLLFSVARCALFKRTVKTTDENFNNTSMAAGWLEKSEFKSLNDLEQNQFHMDAVSADYTIKLWSKGKVNFNPENGFEGEFDSIVVNGKHKEFKQSVQNLSIHDQDNSKFSLEGNLNYDTKVGEKKSANESFYDAKWIYLFGCLLMIGLILAFKRWLHPKKM